ncbi:MAG: helix-turn-helix transcriptional regulator [Candidatus Rokubacteria bacterium]|nr:helix-turn-helix transcriptional regulator [Candidatus Rokubacteria bacterium]
MDAKAHPDVGSTLRLERLRRRLLQRRVAAACNLHPTTLSLIENGWQAPTPTQVAAICAAIGIDPQDISGGGAP